MKLQDLTFVQDVARQSYESVGKVRWPGNKLMAKYANRSGGMIAAEGDIFFMGTCPDLTMRAALMLEQLGEPYGIAVEMHEAHNGFPLMRPHLAIELPRRNAYIDFKRLNEVHVGEGNYSAQSPHSKIVKRIPADGFTARKPLHANLGCQSRDEMDLMFEGLSIRRLIDKMIQDHNDASYAHYMERVPVDRAAIITRL